MKITNALIMGDLPTNANGAVGRVKSGGYLDVTKAKKLSGDSIYIPSLLIGDAKLDECIDYCVKNKPKLIVHAGDDLYDSGTVDVKYHMSPIELLYRTGLLNERCEVVGGICLDRDEISLMQSVGASLIVCPTYSCGKGRGIPLVSGAVGKVKVRLGTYDNSYNLSGDVFAEAKTLLLGTNSVMRNENALSVRDLAGIIGEISEEEAATAMNIV